MWICLDLDGIVLELRISEYKKSTTQWDEEWCKVDLFLRSDEWLNYKIKGQEILLACEVEMLCQALKDLLTDKITQEKKFEWIEPDLSFTLFPKQDIRDQFIYTKPGYEIADIGMDLEIAFWHEGLTGNRLTIPFIRSDIEQLLCYLQLIMNEIPPDDVHVKQLMASKTICESLD